MHLLYRTEGNKNLQERLNWNTPDPGRRYHSDSLGVDSCRRGGPIDRTARAAFGHCPLPCILYGVGGKDALEQSGCFEYFSPYGHLYLI